MPKGDRDILKSDPEDGTTPIANLLLDALVIAKLTSKERAAVLFLIRRTYGWQINGNRLKEAKISFKDWTLALSMDNGHTSTLLANLTNKNVIKRRYIGPTGKDRGYYYSINTILTEWSNSCLNQELLREIANMKLPKIVREVLPKSVTTLASNSCVGNIDKEILNKDRDISMPTDNEIYYKPDGTRDEDETIIHHQSLAKVRRILRGEESASQSNIRMYRAELKRLGIPEQVKPKKENIA